LRGGKGGWRKGRKGNSKVNLLSILADQRSNISEKKKEQIGKSLAFSVPFSIGSQ
jgi:hypothetical protein